MYLNSFTIHDSGQVRSLVLLIPVPYCSRDEVEVGSKASESEPLIAISEGHYSYNNVPAYLCAALALPFLYLLVFSI